MAHKPGHNGQYVIKSSGESYTGLVMRFGNNIYSTKSGAYEGHHSEVLTLASGRTPSKSLPNTPKDVVTTFLAGDSSVFGQQNYFYQSNGNRVPVNTPLHHHTMPQLGNTFFMTQHSMTGAEASLNVVTNRSEANNVRNARRVSQQRQTRGFGDDLGLDGFEPSTGGSINPGGNTGGTTTTGGGY